jgi:hypothetical protein
MKMAEAAEEIEEVAEEFEWPEGWQAQIAGDDDKALTQLTRYKTPADIWTKARALESRITSGELKESSPFPTEGSDEDKAAWRQAQGLPESYDKYEIGRELETDEEKAAINGFLEYAHGQNMTPDNVKAMVDYFYTRQDSLEADRAEGDTLAQQETDDKLRAEWGADYRANINRIDNLIATAPAEVKEDILSARLPDGTPLKASPDVMAFLFDLANLADPVTTVVGQGGDKLAAVQDEIDEIKQMMKTDRNKYNNSPKIQARYRDLLAAQSKLSPNS